MVLFGPGGHTIKMAPLRTGNDILEDKFQALVNINASVPIVQVGNMKCLLVIHSFNPQIFSSINKRKL